jgi:hypothetical protein
LQRIQNQADFFTHGYHTYVQDLHNPAHNQEQTRYYLRWTSTLASHCQDVIRLLTDVWRDEGAERNKDMILALAGEELRSFWMVFWKWAFHMQQSPSSYSTQQRMLYGLVQDMSNANPHLLQMHVIRETYLSMTPQNGNDSSAAQMLFHNIVDIMHRARALHSSVPSS